MNVLNVEMAVCSVPFKLPRSKLCLCGFGQLCFSCFENTPVAPQQSDARYITVDPRRRILNHLARVMDSLLTPAPIKAQTLFHRDL